MSFIYCGSAKTTSSTFPSIELFCELLLQKNKLEMSFFKSKIWNVSWNKSAILNYIKNVFTSDFERVIYWLQVLNHSFECTFFAI